MEFTFKGKLHVLRGVAPKRLKAVENATASKMIPTATHVCLLEVISLDVEPVA